MKKMHLLLLVGLFLVSPFARAGYPVNDPDLHGNDYAALNQGQLKNVAWYWAQQLAASNLGVSNEILDLVNDFADTDNNSVVNLGQLKTVVAPFYDHLKMADPTTLPNNDEWPGEYPWSFPVNPPNDYAVANIGQMKYLLNFDLSAHLPTAADSISGTVTYSGGQNGTIYVMASLEPGRWSRLYSTELSQLGNFSINVAGNNGYFIYAFMDVDGNGKGNGSEPYAIYPFNPVTAGSTEIALTLEDADGDDWGRLNYFGNLNPNEELFKGLLAYYPFSGNADDATVNEHHGEVSGATLTSDRYGVESDAYQFNGLTDQISLADESGFDFEYNDAFTLSFWIKAASTGQDLQAIFAKVKPPENRGYAVYLQDGKLRVLIAHFEPFAELWVDGTTDLRDDQWHHVAVSYDGSAQVEGIAVRVNGVLPTILLQRSTLNLTILNDINPTIGSRSGELGFEGIIDDLAVYGRALVRGEVSALASGATFGDSDHDGISDEQEFQNGSNWRNADSDGDGLLDNEESAANALNPDSDGNGLNDSEDKALAESLVENPLGKGVLVNIPNRGFYHAAETNLNVIYLGN